MENFNQKASMIWNIADILRGGWKQHEYQDVILPLLVLKRLDSILLDSKEKVLVKYNEYKGKINDLDPILKRTSGVAFYNTSDYDFRNLLGEPKHLAKNFKQYLNGYSKNVQDIFEKFDFDKQLERLEGGNLLFLVIQEINKVDLHPKNVDNHQMGQIFEELLRKFSEMSNETAGEHYTPRDVIGVMTKLLFSPDIKDLQKPHVIKKIYDPACGTSGMLSVSKDYILGNINKDADIFLYGQELNSVTYAVAKSDMLIKGDNPDLIRGGEKDHSKASTLSNDQFFGEVFDYGISNPPYGVDWKKDKDIVDREATRGYAGRFGAGTPRISDGQLLFLQHLISKMKPEKDGGSRIAIVHNGSPLFTGDAGSGESEIRRWILEKDLLETIVALPDQLFYNTGINTYLWFVTNRKSKEKKGKVQLIDARTFFKKTRKSLGSKRHEIDPESKKRIEELYEKFEENEFSKIFKNTDFAYRQITIERPLKLSFDVTDEKIIKLSETLGVDLKKVINKIIKKKTEDSEIPLKIMTAIMHLKDKKWNNREVFIKDVLKAFEKQAVKSSQKILKTIIDVVGERDENAEICKDKDGNIEPDGELRDFENVPYEMDIKKYFDKEVKPYVPDAWINESVVDHKDGKVGIVGYEIPFTRYFYKYEAPRSLEVIEKDIEKVENELLGLLKQL
ncbi:MAG: restriction endonuclease subunit M [Tenericutes bacterium GWA2_35_7]|nr:MAG: restriction endonuclease subunit M [Tenericutes bacterium GWA2_35_7]